MGCRMQPAGTLPATWGNMSRLEALQLGFNSLSGGINAFDKDTKKRIFLQRTVVSV
jgi:hypothetical protein